MGAHVVAAASTDEKLALCKAYVADDGINYVREDLRERIKQLTGGKGVDVCYDPVGGVYTEAAIRCMAWEGQHLVIGFTTGEIPRPPLNLALLKDCSIIGVLYGHFPDTSPERYHLVLKQLMQWLAMERIKPAISTSRPLEDAPAALHEIAARKALGKIVLTTALGRGELRP